MKRSNYNIVSENGHGVVLYNTLTGALFVIDPVECADVVSYMRGDDSVIIDSESTDMLLQDGFLVSDEIDEMSILRVRSLLGRTQNQLVVSIMPTLNCNFDCNYCFEERRDEDMSPEVEAKVLRFFAAKLPKVERLSVDWYGGESLIRFEQVIRLNDAIAELCAQNGVDYRVTMTTNGYLLNKEVVDYLLLYNVAYLQITVDGAREDHNRSRPLVGGGETYDQIVGNIKHAVESGIEVVVRVNVWKDNIDNVLDLYDHLEELGLKNRVTVLLKPVLSSEAHSCKESCLPVNRASDMMMEVYRQAALRGWVSVPHVSSMQGYEFCIVDSVGQYIISPTGALFKCGERFDANEQVGFIDEDGNAILDEQKWGMWISKDPFSLPGCNRCILLPVCMGGCSMKRFWKTGESPCIEIRSSIDAFLEVVVMSESNREGGE